MEIIGKDFIKEHFLGWLSDSNENISSKFSQMDIFYKSYSFISF